MKRFQNRIKSCPQKIIHMETAEQFLEPNRIITYVILNFFSDQAVQERNTNCFLIGQCIGGICIDGNGNVGKLLFVSFYLFEGERDDFGQLILHVGLLKVGTDEITYGFKKIHLKNDVPVGTYGFRIPIEKVYIRKILKYDIAGIQYLFCTVNTMADGSVQDIEYFIKKMAVGFYIIAGCEYGVYRILCSCHPVVLINFFHGEPVMPEMFHLASK